jgi:hypothetical protein
MVPLWDLMHSAEPYAKTIEYAVIFVTLIVAIYASLKIRSGAKEIQHLEARLLDVVSRMRQAATESGEELEDSMRKFGHGMGQMLQNMQGQLADLVEGGRLWAPQVEDQDKEEEREQPPQQQQQQEPQESSGDAYDRHRQWWQPIVDMKFDDSEQLEQPRLYWMNNTRTPMPWQGIWLTAWRNESRDGVCGVALSGRTKKINELWRRLRRDADEIQRELPAGSTVEGGRFGIGITKPNSEFRDDDERRAWLKAALNTFVNVLRPRIAKAASRTRRRTGDDLAALDEGQHAN